MLAKQSYFPPSLYTHILHFYLYLNKRKRIVSLQLFSRYLLKLSKQRKWLWVIICLTICLCNVMIELGLDSKLFHNILHAPSTVHGNPRSHHTRFTSDYVINAMLTVVYPIRNGHFRWRIVHHQKGKCEDFDYYRSV